MMLQPSSMLVAVEALPCPGAGGLQARLVWVGLAGAQAMAPALALTFDVASGLLQVEQWSRHDQDF